MVRVKCIDASDKPIEIGIDHWLEEGEYYHVTFIAMCLPAKCQGFLLFEKYLDKTDAPYEYYKASRFAIEEKDLEDFFELSKNCTELNDFSLEELLESTQIETINI